jgi:phenylpropionate dioxygenase-like ring-hydroxylating dioxygenase large terminal subunit
VQECQGLLWVWPESGADAWLEASSKPPVVVPELNDPEWGGADGGFIMANNPIAWDIMTENSFDPSHAVFLHDGTINKWRNNAPMHSRIKDSTIDTLKGFTMTHDGYTKQQKEQGFQAERNFMPPCTVRVCYSYPNGSKNLFGVYFVPCGPGETLTFFKTVSNGASMFGNPAIRTALKVACSMRSRASQAIRMQSCYMARHRSLPGAQKAGMSTSSQHSQMGV